MVLYKFADLLYRNVAELIKSRLEELCRPGASLRVCVSVVAHMRCSGSGAR